MNAMLMKCRVWLVRNPLVRSAVSQCGGEGGGAGCSGWKAEPSDGRSVKPGIVGFITDTDSENAPSPAFRFTYNIEHSYQMYDESRKFYYRFINFSKIIDVNFCQMNWWQLFI